MPDPLSEKRRSGVQFVWWGWRGRWRIITPRDPGGLMANIYKRHCVIGRLEVRWWA